MRCGRRGFTLIELLIVVVIIGILAAIAIPNLLNAVQRGKQKRTMSDIRAIAIGAETYAIDSNDYVAQGAGPITVISSFLEPTYMKAVPDKDAWGSLFQYDGSAKAYTLTSYGKDRQAGGGGTVGTGGQTTAFENDLIFSNGAFIQYPDGTQR